MTKDMQMYTYCGFSLMVLLRRLTLLLWRGYCGVDAAADGTLVASGTASAAAADGGALAVGGTPAAASSL